MVKIGIIGGTGLGNPDILEGATQKQVSTPYGNPTSSLTCGKISGVDVVIIARHGKQHEIMPTQVNFQANVWALHEEGCSHILAVTAVGSLREEIAPGYLVFPDQFIDFTKHRNLTFFTDKVVHTTMAEPYDGYLRELIAETAEELKMDAKNGGTVITIEGPRFSTKAESHMFRAWGADIINMSSCPEVILANELKIPYQTIAMSTDYDCWRDGEEHVTWEQVLKVMKQNEENVKKLLIAVVPKIKSR